MFKRLIPLLFLPLFALSSGADAAVIDRILVIVDDDVITEREFINSVQRQVQELRVQGEKIPPRAELEREAMEQLILERIQLQFADRMGVTVTDAQVERAIESIAKRQNISMSDFMRQLIRAGFDPDEYRQNIRNQLRIQRVVDREVRQRIVVSDREVEKEIQRIGAEQKQAEVEYDISHILITVPDGADEEERASLSAKARDISEKIRAGTAFASLARQFSDAPDAEDGGSLGFRKLSQLPDLFANAISEMDAGTSSDVLDSPSGFHILHLNATRGGVQQLVDQWRVRHILLNTDERDANEARADLLLLKTRIAQGEDFAELAGVHSDDSRSRVKGGDLGWVSPGDTLPEFEAVIRNLADNEVSDPVQTRFGLHLVQVLEHRVEDLGQERTRVQAERLVRQRKGREAYNQWLARIREEAYVKFRVKP